MIRLLFLVPLSLGFICSYFARNSDEDIAYLTGVISLICFAISLFISPWQIQVIILVILLINFRRFFPKNDTETSDNLSEKVTITEENNINQKNSLSKDNNIIKYRGVSYHLHDTETSIIEEEIVGKYRGKVFRTHHGENLNLKSNSDSKFQLKYRGVNLNSSSNSNQNQPEK